MNNYFSYVINGYLKSYMGLSRVAWLGITLTFLNAVSIGLGFFLSLYFVNDLHIKMELAGFFISSYGLGTVVGGIVGGKLSDRISPRLIIMLSLLVQAAAFFILPHLRSVQFILCNLFVLGFAGYCFKTANNFFLLSQCDSQSNLRLKTLGISHAASNLGLGFSGIIVGGIDLYGFKTVFYFSSIILFFSVIYVFLQNKERASIRQLPREESVRDFISLDKLILAYVLTSVFFIGLIIAQLSTTYPIFVQSLFPELGVKMVSFLFILDTVLIVVFQAPITRLLGDYNKITVVGSGAFLMGLGMWVLNFSSSVYMATLSCIIWTTGEMFFISTAQLLCYEKGGEKKRGQSLGMFQATFAISNVVGPALGGGVYQHFGPSLIWYVSFIIGTICLLISFRMKQYA